LRAQGRAPTIEHAQRVKDGGPAAQAWGFDAGQIVESPPGTLWVRATYISASLGTLPLTHF
jgi:hypothetical protein